MALHGRIIFEAACRASRLPERAALRSKRSYATPFNRRSRILLCKLVIILVLSGTAASSWGCCSVSVMPPAIIAVIGSITRDCTTITEQVPDDGETVVASGYTEQPGGKGASTAVACYRLTRPNPKNCPDAREDVENDVRVRMVGAVGADDYGGPLKENLMNCGVNVDGVSVVNNEVTAVANIVIEQNSEENSGAYRVMEYPGAASALGPENFKTLSSLGGGVAPNLLILQLSVGRDTVEQALKTASLERVEVLMKPSPAFYLLISRYSMISHLVMNESEAYILSGCTREDIRTQDGRDQIANYFHELGVKNVVITLGGEGAYYSNESSGSGNVEAEKNCTVLDTCGAGESFVGGYAAKYMEQKQKGVWDLKAAVQYGCKAAARVIEYPGRLDPIVWADEVDIPRHH